MLKWNYPSWWNNSEGFDLIKDETSLREEIVKMDALNLSIRKEVATKLIEFQKFIKDVFGENHKYYKYVSHINTPFTPLLGSTLSDRIRHIKEKQEKESKLKKVEEDKNNQKVLLDKAIKWLQVRGKVYGMDFTVDDAIDYANEICFEEKIKEMNSGGHYHEFGGDDNCENCKGWDGESHRCDCGNRRLYWAKDYSFSFDKSDNYIYPETN